MAITYEEFVAKSNAELCGDNLIVGVGPGRRVVGSIGSGAFVLNEEGQVLAAELEQVAGDEVQGKAKKSKAKPDAEAPAPEVPAE